MSFGAEIQKFKAYLLYLGYKHLAHLFSLYWSLLCQNFALLIDCSMKILDFINGHAEKCQFELKIWTIILVKMTTSVTELTIMIAMCLVTPSIRGLPNFFEFHKSQ